MYQLQSSMRQSQTLLPLSVLSLEQHHHLVEPAVVQYAHASAQSVVQPGFSPRRFFLTLLYYLRLYPLIINSSLKRYQCREDLQ